MVLTPFVLEKQYSVIHNNIKCYTMSREKSQIIEEAEGNPG
jgi:hypothetical protein